jgi:hypothetical protein
MKKTLLLITFVLGLSYSAFAGACVTATLAVYDATGFSCSIGDLTFSGFNYTSSGSISIPAGDVTVTPETVGGEAGFQFNAPWFALPDPTAPNILDSFIGYTATCDATCQINDWVLKISGASAPGDSAINVSETADQLSSSLSVGSLGGVTTTSDSGTFPPVGSLTVGKDLLVYGGTSISGGKFAQVSSLTNLFSTTSTVPEPSLAIVCLGLLGLVPVARRKFVR